MGGAAGGGTGLRILERCKDVRTVSRLLLHDYLLDFRTCVDEIQSQKVLTSGLHPISDMISRHQNVVQSYQGVLGGGGTH